MIFQLILNEQTPALPLMVAPERWIQENSDLLKSFLAYTVKRGDAVGLAANQLSLDGERLKSRFFAMQKNEKWCVVVDPHIMDRRGIPETEYEGCLTWPGKKIIAERFPGITASYYDINGEYVQSEDFDGFEAQVFQHEYDHLEGVVEKMVGSDYQTFRNEVPEIGRNEPCPCGSGRKYKKCCGKNH